MVHPWILDSATTRRKTGRKRSAVSEQTDSGSLEGNSSQRRIIFCSWGAWAVVVFAIGAGGGAATLERGAYPIGEATRVNDETSVTATSMTGANSETLSVPFANVHLHDTRFNPSTMSADCVHGTTHLGGGCHIATQPATWFQS
jgi:hypothetical protein